MGIDLFAEALPARTACLLVFGRPSKSNDVKNRTKIYALLLQSPTCTIECQYQRSIIRDPAWREPQGNCCWSLRTRMQYNPSDPINQTSNQMEPDGESERDLITVTLPPFHIINSCRTLGFSKPLDCFWSEITPDSPHFLQDQLPCTCAEYRRIGSRWSGLRASAVIDVYIHRCLFNEEDTSSIYRMGQCPACHTIYWTREDPA
jgi:hypothetical protein